MVPCLQPVVAMRCLGFLAASFLLAACPGSGGGDDDGLQPDGPPDDGPPVGTGGLVLRIATDRAIPAEIGGDLRISDIRLGGMSIRAIGDAASAGDPRTTTADVELHWDNDDAPDAISFDQAPSGRYSTIKIDVAKINDNGALEIEGAVKIDGDFEPFEVESDDADFVVMIGIGEVLEPGATKTIQLDMEVDGILDGINFQNITPDNEGVRVIDDGTPAELGMVIAALTTAFKQNSGN
jgi:hypothetical protein